VGWDGFIRAPNPDELGWKETLIVSPLEDTFVALRPVTATVPFAVPDKIRALDPTMPLGQELTGPPGGFFDPLANPVTVKNHMVNFGLEYVWHCHILAHEEMDMMHSQAISENAPGAAPTGLVSGEVTNVTTSTTAVYLAWRDNSDHETDWFIQRTNISGNSWTDFTSVPSYSGPQTGGWAMAVDNSIPANTVPNYSYRVIAANVVGDDFVYAGSPLGFPTVSRNSTASGRNTSQLLTRPATATFTYIPVSGDAPLNVTFTDTSTGTVTGWNWDFGDGNFASDNGKQNPSHVYELPGNYTVTLTAMNTGGSRVSGPSSVNVTKVPPPAAPVASFTATPANGTAPLTVTFNADASTSNPAVWATWRWSFGDGTFSSVKNATHTYTAGGVYTVSLTATNLGLPSSTLTRVGYINVTGGTNATATTGVYRPGAGFYLKMDNGSTWNPSTDKYLSWDNAVVDLPVAGDFNKDGQAETGVYRPGAGFYLKMDNGSTWNPSTDKYLAWDNAVVDLPVAGDFNKDGQAETGVYRPGVGFYLKMDNSSTWNPSTDKYLAWDNAVGDRPVAGDWNGDGQAETGVYRPGVGFYLKMDNSSTWNPSTDKYLAWDNAANDLPIAGKFV